MEGLDSLPGHGHLPEPLSIRVATAATPLDLAGIDGWVIERGPARRVARRARRRILPARGGRRFSGAPLQHDHRDAASTAWRAQLYLASGRARNGGVSAPAHRRGERGLPAKPDLSTCAVRAKSRLRRRLDTGEPLDFLLLEELREAGMTDLRRADRALWRGRHRIAEERAHASRGDARFDPLQGIYLFLRDRCSGRLRRRPSEAGGDALPYLALAVKSRSTFDVARTLLETYIGADAGRHVLTGEIDRHSVQRIRAVIWFCDLARLFERRESRAAGGAAWRSSTRTSKRWRVRCSTTRARS